MAIVHITFDYPDTINKIKTKAVFNLIETQTKIPNLTIRNVARMGK